MARSPSRESYLIALVLALRGSTPPQVVTDDTSRMVTDATPSAISFGDVYISVDARSALEMRRTSTQRQSVLLERGGAWFTVGERGERPAFTVLAGDTSVRVVGTRFRVARSEELVTVEVERGSVEVAFRGQGVRVGPKQQWSSKQPDVVADVKVAIAEPAPQTPQAPQPVKPARPARPKPLQIAPAPATPPVPADPAIADRERAAYERLVAIEATDPATALTGYVKLANGSSRWTEVALFAAGRLAADRKDARAKALLGSYMRRFPRGANVDDARELLAHLP